MPDTCPHCGFRLPMVVDAYCPDCREDLGEPPETVTAPDGREVRRCPTADVALEAVICWVGAVLIGLGALFAAFAGEWLGVLAAAAAAGLLAAVAARIARPAETITSITGREKTREHPE